MKRIFLGLNANGESVYFTTSGIVAKRQGRPPWHTTIVKLLVELHGISPAEYESYRRGVRELGAIFLDTRLQHYPTWVSLHGDRRYRYKPVELYFATADQVLGTRRDPSDLP